MRFRSLVQYYSRKRLLLDDCRPPSNDWNGRFTDGLDKAAGEDVQG